MGEPEANPGVGGAAAEPPRGDAFPLAPREAPPSKPGGGGVIGCAAASVAGALLTLAGAGFLILPSLLVTHRGASRSAQLRKLERERSIAEALDREKGAVPPVARPE